MRRIFLGVSIAAFMTVMVVTLAVPAFARTLVWCSPPNDGHYWGASLYVCDENGHLVNDSSITDEEWRQLEEQLLYE